MLTGWRAPGQGPLWLPALTRQHPASYEQVLPGGRPALTAFALSTSVTRAHVWPLLIRPRRALSVTQGHRVEYKSSPPANVQNAGRQHPWDGEVPIPTQRPQAATQHLTWGELSFSFYFNKVNLCWNSLHTGSAAVYGVPKSRRQLGDSTATKSLAQLKNHSRGRLVDM